MQAERIVYYDSSRKKGRGSKVIGLIYRYLQEEHRRKRDGRKLPGGWEQIESDTCPQQDNDYDCGAFTCMYMDFLSLGWPLDRGQETVSPFYRQFIASAIVRQALPVKFDY